MIRSKEELNTMPRHTNQNYQTLANNDISASMSCRNVHDHLKQFTVPELYEINMNDRLPFAVAVLNVTGELNVGTIVRNALLTGAHTFGCLGRRRFDKRGCVGSENYINIDCVDALLDDGITIDSEIVWKWFDDNNYVPIFVEQGGTIVQKMDWQKVMIDISPKQPCFVFGNENRGIPDSVMNDSRKSYKVSINQRGIIRSYNVGSASAIILHDFAFRSEIFE